MNDIQEINDLLRAYPLNIYKAAMRTEELREKWMLEDARKDYETARAFLLAKAGNVTEGMAKAKATESVFELTQHVIIAESAFRRALADQIRLENEFTSVRKRANLIETSLANTARAA